MEGNIGLVSAKLQRALRCWVAEPALKRHKAIIGETEIPIKRMAINVIYGVDGEKKKKHAVKFHT